MTDMGFRKIWEALYPYAAQKMQQAQQNNTRFAHYTSAYAALQIIQKKKVWMRSAAVMNDFSEVQHGQQCIAAAWNDKIQGQKFRDLLDSIEKNLSGRLLESFDSKAFDRNRESFLISISEHGHATIDEDRYGRLSMWRAYGGNTNVAFVFNNGPFLRESNATNAFTSPVFYGDDKAFILEFAKVVRNLEEHLELAKSFGGEAVKEILEIVFHFAALSTKHSGFSEEREWRVILSPTMFPSDKVKFDIETIDGVPQRVYKFPLENYPAQGFTGVTLPELLEELIIGPTEHGFTIYDALVRALEEAGVENASRKVKLSGIPLRR